MEEAIRGYLIGSRWLEGVDDVSFLAAGEYNQNFLVTRGRERYVFRINRGSQLGLERQISYEARVLRALEGSGVTPRVYGVDEEPSGLPGGVLLMEFLPGGPLDYRRDGALAAAIFARVHTRPVVDGLVAQPDPVAAIARESLELIERYPDSPLAGQKEALLRYHRRIAELARGRPFAGELQCIVNTEVNSGNFLVDGSRAWLVDWEKAVVSCRYQDLGHFLVPTTTQWKTDVVFTEEEKRDFLRAYREHIPSPPTMDELLEKTRIMERTILLRALAWCFMAHYEYTHTSRALANPETFARISRYMKEIDRYIGPGSP